MKESLMTKLCMCMCALLITVVSGTWSHAAEEGTQTAWEPSERTAAEIEHQAFKDGLQDTLDHLVDASPDANGYFKTSFNRQWQPEGKQRSHLVSQTRLLYVMAQGYDLTQQSKYLDALRNGADFLLKYYRASQNGRWYWRVSPEGDVIDRSNPAYDAYGQAFVIFGLSHAYRITNDERYLEAALATWENLEVWEAVGASRAPTEGYSQNPLMHTFEALLTLHDATGMEGLLDDARRLGDFVLERLYQEEHAYIPEEFKRNWQPLPIDQGGYVDIGHQFEWAYLLSWAAQKGLPEDYIAIGEQLIDAAFDKGYDPELGGILAQHDYQGRASGRKGLWQQCEFLRASMRYASLHGRDDLWEPFQKTWAFVSDVFIDEVFGGWFISAADPEAITEDRPSKGTPWRVGYHITGMYVAGLNLTRSEASHTQSRMR